jgi:hypothetical protein
VEQVVGIAPAAHEAQSSQFVKAASLASAESEKAGAAEGQQRVLARAQALLLRILHSPLPVAGQLTGRALPSVRMTENVPE